MNITYNNKTPENMGAWLATRPILSHSSHQGGSYELPLVDGRLFEEDYRGDAEWEFVIHMKNDNFSKQMRKVRQWLSGTGKLVISDTTDSFYEVKRVVLSDNTRQSEKYGRVKVTMTCYPYEFLNSGNTAISGGGTIANPNDASKPLYKITGNGDGVLTVNGKTMNFTVKGTLYIDTRREFAYNGSNVGQDTNISGDYKAIRLKSGNNSVSITSGFTLETYPKWGFEI